MTNFSELKSGVDILVATPGRLIDFLGSKLIRLSMVKYFVIDEADKMLDMGFEPQLNQIKFKFDLNDKTCTQNLMFSATFSKEIRALAESFLRDYIYVTNNMETTANENINQEFFEVTDEEKIFLLHKTLQEIKGKVLSK